MPGYENTLTAGIRGGKLQGRYRCARRQVSDKFALPRRGRRSVRFFEEPSSDNAD